jgi:hypothetical protein
MSSLQLIVSSYAKTICNNSVATFKQYRPICVLKCNTVVFEIHWRVLRCLCSKKMFTDGQSFRVDCVTSANTFTSEQ